MKALLNVIRAILVLTIFAIGGFWISGLIAPYEAEAAEISTVIIPAAVSINLEDLGWEFHEAAEPIRIPMNGAIIIVDPEDEIAIDL